MSYHGDIKEDNEIMFVFTTNASDGSRTSASSTFEEGDFYFLKMVESTGTITSLTATGGIVAINNEPDSKTGIYVITVDTSVNAFFEVGADYAVCLYPDETIDSQQVSAVVGEFSIENRGTNVERIAGSDVNTGLAQLGVNVVEAGATAWGSGAITTASFSVGAALRVADYVWDEPKADHTGATTFGDLATDLDTANTNIGTPAAASIAADIANLNDLSAADVNAQVDTALADVNLDHLVGTATGIPAVPAGTYLDQIMDDGTATYDRTTDSLQATRDALTQVDTVVDGIQTDLDNGTDGLGALKTIIDAIQTDLDNGTDGLGALKTAIDALPSVSDNWTTALTESYGTDGAAMTGAQMLYIIMQRLVDFDITGVNLSVKKLDGTTEAYNVVHDSASDPTNAHRNS